MKNGLILALSAALLAPFAAHAGPGDTIETRQQLMKDTRDALKPLMGMRKGEIAFDAATVDASLATFAEVAGQFGDLFPAGSESGHDTEAKSTIWSDRDGFESKLQDFGNTVAAVQASAPASVDQLSASLKDILGTCKGCHDGYRVEKD